MSEYSGNLLHLKTFKIYLVLIFTERKVEHWVSAQGREGGWGEEGAQTLQFPGASLLSDD